MLVCVMLCFLSNVLSSLSRLRLMDCKFVLCMFDMIGMYLSYVRLVYIIEIIVLIGGVVIGRIYVCCYGCYRMYGGCCCLGVD